MCTGVYSGVQLVDEILMLNRSRDDDEEWLQVRERGCVNYKINGEFMEIVPSFL